MSVFYSLIPPLLGGFIFFFIARFFSNKEEKRLKELVQNKPNQFEHYKTSGGQFISVFLPKTEDEAKIIFMQKADFDRVFTAQGSGGSAAPGGTKATVGYIGNA